MQQNILLKLFFILKLNEIFTRMHCLIASKRSESYTYATIAFLRFDLGDCLDILRDQNYFT